MQRGKRQPAPLRVVVDVNVLISFLIGKRLGGFLPLLQRGDIILLISPPMLAELVDVAARPKLRSRFPIESAHELVLLLASMAETIDVEPGGPKRLSRDPKDDYLLHMAHKGKADVLVTGDDDLLTLERYRGTSIMNARTFTDKYLK